MMLSLLLFRCQDIVIAPLIQVVFNSAKRRFPICGFTRKVPKPGVNGSTPISFRTIIFAGADPQAWFRSRLGLYNLSQASMVIVEPTRSILYQLLCVVA